jgi:hypothetical protein
MKVRFNPPPNRPPLPEGWEPKAGWKLDPLLTGPAARLADVDTSAAGRC